jgi:2-polyprenyl-3-methyl-5-hydroxy-6-metoxy-1,4-benzoquinol methylase
MRVAEAARRSLLWPANRIRAMRERSVKTIASKNTVAAFDEIYNDDDLTAEYAGPERLAFYDEVAAFCAAASPRRVVDVGCGTGHLLAALVRLQPDVASIVGVDPAPAAIRRLSQLVPEARGYVASVYELDLGGERFDLVLATEVLEHLDRPCEALDALRAICADGGHIVVTVPDGARDDWKGHVNFWTADELLRFLARVGRARVARTRSDDLLGVVEL